MVSAFRLGLDPITRFRRFYVASSRNFKMSDSTPTRRRFAPLGAGLPADNLATLQGIIFDVDGTLCEPQNYMFGEMRSVLGITKATDILDHIYSLPEGKQEEAMESIRKIEREAMVNQRPQPGLKEIMDYISSKNIPKGICTRNFDAPVHHLLTKFIPEHVLGPVITREFKPPKPSPAGILHIAKAWNVPPTNVIMVGDSIDDMTAGRRAGAATVLLVNEVNKELSDHPNTDLVVKRLDDLIDILEKGFTGREITI